MALEGRRYGVNMRHDDIIYHQLRKVSKASSLGGHALV